MTFNCQEIANRLNIQRGREKDKYYCFMRHDDKTASLSITEFGFHCFGCGVRGNAIDLVILYFCEYEKKTFTKQQAIRWIKKKIYQQ